MQCVVEMGNPKADAIETVRATASSAQYPRDGVILAISTPNERMTLSKKRETSLSPTRGM
jgi:hypothetical protein